MEKLTIKGFVFGNSNERKGILMKEDLQVKGQQITL